MCLNVEHAKWVGYLCISKPDSAVQPGDSWYLVNRWAVLDNSNAWRCSFPPAEDRAPDQEHHYAGDTHARASALVME